MIPTMNYVDTRNECVCEAKPMPPRPIGGVMLEIEEQQNKALCILADILSKIEGKQEPPDPRGADNLTQMANLCCERMAIIINGLMHINEVL